MFWNRKRLIIFLIICLILSLFFMYKDNNKIKLEKTVQTNGTPVSSYTIILDAGHGEPDGGATSESRNF